MDEQNAGRTVWALAERALEHNKAELRKEFDARLADDARRLLLLEGEIVRLKDYLLFDRKAS